MWTFRLGFMVPGTFVVSTSDLLEVALVVLPKYHRCHKEGFLVWFSYVCF